MSGVATLSLCGPELKPEGGPGAKGQTPIELYC